MVSIVDTYGVHYYNKQDQRHREDGPAIEYSNGTKYWYINGYYHKTAGPAIEYSDGTKVWYIMDKGYSYEEWLAIKDFPLLW